MKQTSRLLFATIFIFTVAQFAACKKKPVTPPTVEVCQITHMNFSVQTSNYTAAFKYNSVGNPTSVTVSVPTTGSPNVLFIYDKYNRVTDYIGVYGNYDPANFPSQFSYEFWFRYAYADQNPSSLPVADTARLLGIYNNGDLNIVTSAKFTENFMFDAQGRMVKLTASGNYPSYTYTYDASGNLVLPNKTYDDKKSFRQTNKIWMLVDRNYSVNNAFTATTYNTEGYPTVIPATTYPNFNADFLHRSMGITALDYSCSIQQAAD